MALIDDRNIKLRPSRRAHIIKFTDGNFLYHFHMTKNTLYKAFDTTNALDVIEIPAGIDGKLLGEALKEFTVEDEKEADLITTKEYVILPLFSTRTKEVPEKSGLNQWNAGGRARDYDEVYIPIPKIVHKAKPDFFPARDSHFKLKTQDGREFTAKVCQDNSKALMTTPNKDLGKWLLRDVLGLEYGQIADYDFLKEKGADTVIIYKLSESEYQIALHTVGVFQEEYSEED